MRPPPNTGPGVTMEIYVELSENIEAPRELASRAPRVGVPDSWVAGPEEASVTPTSIICSIPLSTPTAATVMLAVLFKKQL